MIFSELAPFSLNAENIKKFSFLEIKNISKKEVKKKKPVVDFSIFIPEYSDTLFWCYYLILNSITDYKLVENDFLLEKSIKISLIQKVREHKDILKKMKFKRTEIEDELLNQRKISIKTFLLLCVLENKNIIIKDGIKYLENISNPNDETIEIIEKKR
tara:strand:+ start:1212 stop:1685 length:474 start_codon:yes stop_codon:yes gene_type:complete